ncbi:hypothetical protein Tco_1219529 [Tanacetum coccineum]
MLALMVQQGCEVALETLPVDMEAVTKKTTAAGIWIKLTSLYMTKSLTNKLYLKKMLYTYNKSPSTKLDDHIHEFNNLIVDLANIDIKIEDEDQTLMLLTSLPSSYENFVETLLYGRESLTMEDVLATLKSRDLKKKTEGTKDETGDGLYVRGRSDHLGKAHSGGSLQFMSRGGTGKLKCCICHSEGHLKIDSSMMNSSGFVKKGKRDQDSDYSYNEGNAYYGESLMVVGNDKMTELVMNSGGSYHMTHRRDFLYEFKVVGLVQLGDIRTYYQRDREVKIQLHDGSNFILEDVRYVPKLRRSLISLCTLKKESYNVKMQMGRIKVIKGSKKVEFKQLCHKQVGFKQLGPSVETRGHGVQIDKCVWCEVEMQEAQGNSEAEEQEKVHLGIKVEVNIMVIGVPGQNGAESNVAEKKKSEGVYRSKSREITEVQCMIDKVVLIQVSSTRKRC